MFFIFSILFPLLLCSQSFAFDISGKVFRRDKMEKIDNAFVILSLNNEKIHYQAVEEDGSFRFRDLPPKLYVLEVKAPGFYPEKRKIPLTLNTKLSLYLTPLPSFGEIEVVGEKNKGTGSKTSISKEAREKSQTSITGDPLTVLGSLPGVTLNSPFSVGSEGQGSKISIGKSSTPFSVRGGSGKENIAFLDDVPIPFPYHQAFPDSVFIDSLIGDISLYKGVLPANYGQVLSSVLDLQILTPTEGIHGKFNLGLLNTYLTLKGQHEKWNWIVGIRRTHYDFLLWLITSLIQPAEATEDLEISFPYYIDTQGKIDYQDSQDQFRFLWQASLEPTEVKYPAISNSFHLKLDYQSATANLTWKRRFNPSLSVKNSLQWIGGHFYSAFFITNLDTRSNAIDIPREVTNRSLLYDDNRLNTLRFQSEFSFKILQGIRIKTGIESYLSPFVQYSNLIVATEEITNTAVTNITNIYIPTIGTNTITNIGGLTFSYQETNVNVLSYTEAYSVFSPYLLFEIEIPDFPLHLYPGIRFNYQDFLNLWNVDPRLTLQFPWNEQHKSFFAVGMLSQFNPNAEELAKLKDFKDKIQSPRVFQTVIGHQWKFLNAYKLNGEIYYKDYDFLITEKTNSGGTLYQSEGYDKRVGGIEIFLIKQPDPQIPFYGWASFSTYQIWAKRDADTVPMQESIKGIEQSPENQWFLQYIQKYRFNLNLIWPLNPSLTLNMAFNWNSGGRKTPITNIISYTNPFTGEEVFIETKGEYSSVQLPDEHSLSLKLEYQTLAFERPFGCYAQINNIYHLWFYHSDENSVIQTDFDSRQINDIHYYYDANAPNGVGQEYTRNFLGFFVTFGAWIKW